MSDDMIPYLHEAKRAIADGTYLNSEFRRRPGPGTWFTMGGYTDDMRLRMENRELYPQEIEEGVGMQSAGDATEYVWTVDELRSMWDRLPKEARPKPILIEKYYTHYGNTAAIFFAHAMWWLAGRDDWIPSSSRHAEGYWVVCNVADGDESRRGTGPTPLHALVAAIEKTVGGGQ